MPSTPSAAAPVSTETEDRTAMVSARLKALYSKHILPIEKRYQYEFFFESPLLSDVEFDGMIYMLATLVFWLNSHLLFVPFTE